MDTLQKAFGYLIRFEHAKIWRALSARIPSWLYCRKAAYLYQLKLNAGELDYGCPMSLPEEYSFRQAASDDLAACSAMAGLSAEEFLRRHGAGDLCYCVFYRNQPVNVNWLHFGPCYVRGMGYRLHSDVSDCYVYGVVTSPDHRNIGLYKASQRELIRVVRSLASPRILQLVYANNVPVLATLPKLGYEILHVLHHRTVFGVKWTTLRDREGTLLDKQLHFGNASSGMFQI